MNNNNFNYNNKINKEPIAIIGISCRLPGGITNYNDYVEVIKNGTDCLEKTPSDRWNVDILSRKQPKLNNRIGGYLKSIEEFDNQFFGISPKEAQCIDPQQRLLLHLAVECLEDGKISLDEIKSRKVGIFIGSSSNDYIRGFDMTEINQFTTSGSNSSFLSNRLSYFLDVNGPSITVNTACSASMVAIHLGLSSIWNGESCSVLVGGVNIISSPLQSMDFGKAGLLNTDPDGRCYSFEQRASGYVRSEGGAILMLKPLSSAIKDGDKIYSVFLNSGNNSNGKTPNGITSPRSICQESLIEKIIKESDIKIDSIGYFECHGTGTQQGDLNEIQAIGRAIGIHKSNGPLVIGSVKASIGHLEGASGIAGVIKSIICIKEKLLPPQCKFQGYNPKIPFEQLNLKVLSSIQDWSDKIRIAGVNSFGVGGSNANLFLSSFDKQPQHILHVSQSTIPISLNSSSTSLSLSLSSSSNSINSTSASSTIDLITISVSSTNKEDLIIRVQDIYNTLIQDEDIGDITFNDLAHTLNNRTSHYSNRIVFLCNGGGSGGNGNKMNTLKANMKLYLDSGGIIDSSNNKSILVSSTIGNNNEIMKKKLAFIFSGQGQQSYRMAYDLYSSCYVFREEINKFSKYFEKISGWSIVENIFGYDEIDENKINETWLAQPSIVAIQFALVSLLFEMGIEPTLVIGHSLGELTSAYFAGILSYQDTLQLLYIRSYLQNTTKGTGKMYVVLLPKSEVDHLISTNSYDGKIVICGNNSNRACAIAGDCLSINQFTTTVLTLLNVTFREIKTGSAFHSHLMDVIKDDFYKMFPKSWSANESLIPFYSTCYGRYLTSTECKTLLSSPDYWWKNIRESVLFKECIDDILKTDQVFTFIEISAHPILNYFVNQSIRTNSTLKLTSSPTLYSTLSKDSNSYDCLIMLVAKLYSQGLNGIKWTQFYNNDNNCNTLFQLPGKRWKMQKYWIENIQKQIERINPPRFISLEKRLFSVTPSFETRLNQDRFKWLLDHKIQQLSIVPFSFFIELVYCSLAELGSTVNSQKSFKIQDFKIDSTIIISDRTKVNNNIVGINFNSDCTKFEIGSVEQTLPIQKWKIHASGTIVYNVEYITTSNTSFSYLNSKKSIQCWNSNEFYNEISKLDYNYSNSFQALTMFKLIDSTSSLSVLELKSLEIEELKHQIPSDFRCIHPSLLDAVLQSAIIPACKQKQSGLWIPTSISSISINLPSLELNQYFNFINNPLYCLLNSIPTSNDSTFSTNIQIFELSTNSLICEIKELQFKLISTSIPKSIPVSPRIVKNSNTQVIDQVVYPLISEYKWNKEDDETTSINEGIKFTDNYQTVIFCSTNLNDNQLLESIIISSIKNGHDENKIYIVSPMPIESDLYNNRIIINYENQQESDFDGLFAIINNNGNSTTCKTTTRFIILPNFNSISITSSGTSTPDYIENENGEQIKIEKQQSLNNNACMGVKSFTNSNISMFHLQKAIIKNNMNGRFYLITNGGQTVNNILLPTSPQSSSSSTSDKHLINLSQYQLIGQVRVFSNEFNQFMECTMIDIQYSTSCELIVNQLNSITLPKWELAIRDNIIYSYQLVEPITSSTTSMESPTTADKYYQVELSDSGVISDLKIKQIRQPTCQVDQVVVLVEYSTLNFRDILKSLGRDYDSIHLSSMGDEFSGSVIEIGEDVKHLSIGDKVFGIDMSKSMGNKVTCCSDLVFKVPTTTSTAESTNSLSTIPIVFLTAWYSIVVQGRLKQGEKILIHSGCGGVGLAAIQICQFIGADIFVTVGSIEKKEYLVNQFGLNKSKIYSSRSLQFYNDIMTITNGQGVDCCLNSLSGEYLEKSILTLSPYGRFIEIGKKDIYSNSKLSLFPFRNNISFIAIDIAQMTINRRSYLRELMNEILVHFKNGIFKPLQQTIFKANDLIKAIRYMSSGNHIGKILIDWNGFDSSSTSSEIINLPVESIHGNNSTYIFTGLGGVTQSLVGMLSEQSDIKNIIFISKNGIDSDEKVKFINQLKESGLNVRVENCDCSSSDQVDSLFNKLINGDQVTSIRGIFHLASHINDKRIIKHDLNTFNYVYDSKAISAWNLHCQSIKHQLKLDYFTVFGSAITILGNIGQSNYTTANRFVEGLTYLRISMGLNSNCIHLGSVPTLGMASNESVLNTLNSLGFTPFENLTIMNNGFKKLLNNYNNSVVVLGEINTDRFIESIPNFRGKNNFKSTSLFKQQTQHQQHIEIIKMNGHHNENEDEEWIDQANEDIDNQVDIDSNSISILRNLVCDILELNEPDLNNSISFNEYGLDSLLSSELSNSIQKKFKVLIPSLTLVDNSTILSTIDLIKLKLPKSSQSDITTPVIKKIKQPTPTQVIIEPILPQVPPILNVNKLSNVTLSKPVNSTNNELTSPPHSARLSQQQPSNLSTVIFEISPIAAPNHRYQSDVLKEVKQLTNSQGGFIENIYNNCKIRSRYCFNNFNEKSMAEINELDAGERVALFKQQTYESVINAGKTVIERAGIDKSLISHVVGVTSTGIMAPSFDVVLIEKLGLPLTTSRTMINFMGCGAAVNSMRAASAYAKARPGTYVLIVAVESSGTCMKFDFEKRSDLLSQCIFTDGCVGTLITCQPRHKVFGKLEIIDDLSYLMKDSQDTLNLFIGSTGIDLDLKPELPLAINRNIKNAFQLLLANNNLTQQDIEFYATHPGGAKILNAVQEGLDLQPEDLSDSFEVMKRYGNMVGVSTYYVLRRILDKNKTLLQEGSLGYKYGIALAFSPGASIESILFKLIQ